MMMMMMDPILLMTCGFLSSEDVLKMLPQLQMILKQAPSHKPPVKHRHVISDSIVLALRLRQLKSLGDS